LSCTGLWPKQSIDCAAACWGHGHGRWAVTVFQREQARTASAGRTPGLNRLQGCGSEDGADWAQTVATVCTNDGEPAAGKQRLGSDWRLATGNWRAAEHGQTIMTTEQVGGSSIFISCRERRRHRMAVERGPLSIVQKQRVRVGGIESVHKQAGPRQRVGGCASDGARLGLADDATTLGDKVQYRFLPGERRASREEGQESVLDGRQSHRTPHGCKGHV
jgi:hypothetical protein